MGIVERKKSVFPLAFFDASEAKAAIVNNFDFVKSENLKLRYNQDAKVIMFDFPDNHNGLYPVMFAVNKVKSGYMIHEIFANGQIQTCEVTK